MPRHDLELCQRRRQSNQKRNHPAAFPDKIPFDFIRVFTRPGDIILAPMVGSDSSIIAADLLKRKWIGIDNSEAYCTLAKKRLAKQQSNLYPGFKNRKDI